MYDNMSLFSLGLASVYTGGSSQHSYTVPGLNYFTNYQFRLEACTSRGCEVGPLSTIRTLPAAPESQPAPSLVALADENGAHMGVRVTWQPPSRPNGIISEYQIYRRDVLIGVDSEFSLKLYSTMAREDTKWQCLKVCTGIAYSVSIHHKNTFRNSFI